MTPATASALRAVDCRADAYVPHAIHAGDREWSETNCYLDVWIELLHALGHEPLAGLGLALRIDHEADQWTFVKFSHDELHRLYGVTVVELSPWQSVLDQTRHAVGAGRIVLAEVDSFFLPDTRGTSYRTSHDKTTIGIGLVDERGERLGYFHNAGFFELEGEDYRGILGLDDTSPVRLPPYLEMAKPHAAPALEGRALADEAIRLLRDTLERLPVENPFIRFRAGFAAELEWLRGTGPERYHAYAFANFRQFGSAFFLAAMHLAWLREKTPAAAGLGATITACGRIASIGKALQLRTARSALAGKAFDAAPLLDDLVGSWDEAVSTLRRALDSRR